MTTQAGSKLSLEQARKQTKDLHKSHSDRDAQAVERFKSAIPQLRGDVFAAKLSPRDAQRVIAHEHGFECWLSDGTSNTLTPFHRNRQRKLLQRDSPFNSCPAVAVEQRDPVLREASRGGFRPACRPPEDRSRRRAPVRAPPDSRRMKRRSAPRSARVV